MSNKKRIRKKTSKPYEAKYRRAMATIAKLIIEKAFLKAQLAIMVAQKAKSYPSGGFIENDGSPERYETKEGGWEIVPVLHPGWSGRERLQSALDRSVLEAVSTPLKSLEGMLALERQNDRSVKTVFAGNRDYRDLKSK